MSAASAATGGENAADPVPLPASTLVLGGARSGKSRHAEKLVLESGLRPIYVATAEARDGEMANRIAHHRDRRGDAWTTFEERFDLVGLLGRETAPDRAVLVDCLTLWLSNIFFDDRAIDDETDRLARALGDFAGPVVFVSNEIGLGLVPETRLSRDFRDAQGRLNQAVAAACTDVVFVAAGLPLSLKSDNQDKTAP